MADPISVPVTLSPKQIWASRQASSTGINTLLLLNTDLVNTVKVGTSVNSIVVPVPPNGSLSVDPGSNWYVQGTVAGTAPLVVIPNGQGNFRGLTQGLGSLAIPSVFSPNFVHGVSGWSIGSDGSAEFNNLIIRGTFFGFDFEINSNGIFMYNGVPALGNLVGSWDSVAGVDRFGNAYQKDLTVYIGNGGYVNINSSGGFGGNTAVLFNPGFTSHVTLKPQVYGGSQNSGLVNEIEDLILTSGTAGGHDDASIQMLSQSADATAGAVINVLMGGAVLGQWFKTQLNIGTTISATSGTPASPTTILTDSWNNIILDANWTALGGQAVPGYRMGIERRVWLDAALQFNVNIGNNNINGGNPLPAAYRPVTQQFIAGGPGAAGVAINTNGVLVAAQGTLTTVFCNFNGSYPLDR